jgi:hypothetical protein
VPETARPPPHAAENLPVSDVAVWLEISYWKLPHVFRLGSVGSAFDAHKPTRESVVFAVPVPALAFAPVELGASVLDERSNPQLAVSSEAPARSETIRLFILQIRHDALDFVSARQRHR